MLSTTFVSRLSKASFTRQARLLSTLPLTIKQILSRTLETHDSFATSDAPVTVNGWIKSIRKQKRFAFAEIRDGTTHKTLQAVLSSDMAKTLTNGASVQLRGKIVHTPKAPQPMELSVQSVDVLGVCDPEVYPIQKQSLSVQHLRDHVHLRARTDQSAMMLRLRHKLAQSFHDFYATHGFVQVQTPILTANDCEGGGEVFRVRPDTQRGTETTTETTATVPTDFFGKPAFLTVSSQLHLEALSAALNRVYTLSPAFRAEESMTNRHLSEFWMLEAELSFTKDLDVVMDVVEASLKHVLKSLTGQDGMVEEIAALQNGPATSSMKTAAEVVPWTAIIDKPWQRLTYTDAITLLRERPSTTAWGDGLSSEDEKWLAESCGGPVFVTDYPASFKPFYMRANADGKTVSCFDLLAPGVAELVGGSLREERYDLLDAKMRSAGLSSQEYSWYLDLRRYGSVPHGGFGLGFERLVSWISGIDNVRECLAFPRWVGRMAG